MKILAFDIGGSFIKYAVMCEDMTSEHKGKVTTPGTRESLIDTLGEIRDKFADIAVIAVAMPGIIDAEKGVCHMGGGALPYNTGFAIGESIAKRCTLPVHVENDAKCAALAEAAAGSLQDVADGFVLLFGTMIGGGYIKDHCLHRGMHFSAGEVSYINTVRNGPASPENVWGNRCGTPRLCSLYAEKKGLPKESVDGVALFDAAEAGDKAAISALEEFTAEIAVVIFNIQNVLDPQRFAIGGGISERAMFIEFIRAALEKLYSRCPFEVPHAEIVPCKFRNDANLIGAVQCYLADRNINEVK